MKVEVKVPTVGESIVSGILTRWLKKNNEVVKEGDPLFELETDKVNVEVPSPASGKIEILTDEGIEVKIGQLVALIDTDFKAAESVKTESDNKEDIKEKLKSEPVKELSEASVKTIESGGEYQKTSPSVRRIAGENNIDLNEIEGSGKEGRITREDAVNKLNETKEDNNQTIVKMSPIRRTIAKRLIEAKREAAHVTTFNEINMEHVNHIRTLHKDDFFKKYGIKLGFMSFFVKACCQALKEFGDVNTEVRGDEIVYKHFYNIGVAVAVDEGLIVPVIKNADKMSFPQIELRISELAQKARAKKITLDELEGGTFTITNGGIFGSMMSTPIPNYPQTAILGMHAVKDRPYVIDGKIEIRPIMYAALTYDHRVIDGKDAVEFLVSIKKYIEDPESLLIEL
jgi:2-oxoglutarate dehydrogenase E2 component (dihydrolipoamide succinyltransferase)